MSDQLLDRRPDRAAPSRGILESTMPVKLPKFYFGDISRRFAEESEVDEVDGFVKWVGFLV